MKIENKTPIAEEIIRNNPTGYGLFAGIGDNFNSVAQVICELMDDAVSNLRANSGDPELSMTVVLSLENLGDAVEITVTDGGTGIADLGSALTIACRDGAQTPLNEHGFGLKHALASCDSSPDQKWSIRTRTKDDAAANQYREVKAPYSMGTSELDKPMKVRFYSGTGSLPHPTGTSISVRCPMAKFRTVKPDRKAVPSDFHNLVRYIIEELRYVKELTAKRENDPTALRVSREEPVFQKIGLKAKVDLFVGYIDRVTIYEAKAGKTKALDLYQLRMYVDGCALDNKPVDEAVLIAKRHSAEVKELRDILNTLTAPDGRPYNFRLATWDEESIVICQSA